ncbi:DUF2624 domain-containing protein [Halobacillus amylolyticus]|uniref:DUF2624 domain-containing protein n=1 Tax=Halobacillus amylolyticus TaxID=2932259 RepID=A0ABY4HBS8_9BACI|nr:DUF2624 domain-containing protein [Halobacillus amylolyticus]UOR12292.1 DUF2624 domain-containing protein [Halobacillus amylolyticus]
MKHVAQQIIAQKLKQLTVDDLLHYSQKYKIKITRGEAKQIVSALKKSNENPFDPKGRKRMLNNLAAITSNDTARSVNQLLIKLAKEHGVEHWLQ